MTDLPYAGERAGRAPRSQAAAVAGRFGVQGRRALQHLAAWGIATVLFAALAPTTIDSYNTVTNRTFLDLVERGNPYALAPATHASFAGQEWVLDWPYPPLTI